VPVALRAPCVLARGRCASQEPLVHRRRRRGRRRRPRRRRQGADGEERRRRRRREGGKGLQSAARCRCLRGAARPRRRGWWHAGAPAPGGRCPGRLGGQASSQDPRAYHEDVVVVYILGARRIVFLLPRSLLRHLELTVVDHLRQGRGRRAVHRAAHGPATAEHLFDGAAELLGLALVPHLPHDMSNSCCLVRFPECLMFLVFLRSRIGSFRPLMMRLVAFGSTSTFAARFWIVT
ncbi:unnamed protein product, partial [Prorocentrum cordatum]